MMAMIGAWILTGWLDGYYQTNDGITLDTAAVDIRRDAKPLGFHLILAGGEAPDAVHSAEPDRWTRHIYQASVTYDAKIVQLEAGVYPSHIGFEGFFTKDNWNYTRGILAELSPYYQTGVKVSRTLNAHWSAQLHLLRGWQNISDSHAPNALGTQIAYSDAKWSASFNAYLNDHRKFGDLVATYKATPKLTLGTSVDRGRDLPANWLGAGVWARFAIDDRNALAFRAERFRDPDDGISGQRGTLREATVTYELRPRKHTILKLEGRRDAPANKTVAIASAVITFGS